MCQFSLFGSWGYTFPENLSLKQYKSLTKHWKWILYLIGPLTSAGQAHPSKKQSWLWYAHSGQRAGVIGLVTNRLSCHGQGAASRGSERGQRQRDGHWIAEKLHASCQFLAMNYSVACKDLHDIKIVTQMDFFLSFDCKPMARRQYKGQSAFFIFCIMSDTRFYDN